MYIDFKVVNLAQSKTWKSPVLRDELIVNCLTDEHEGFSCRALSYGLSSVPTNTTIYCMSVFSCWSGGK